MTIKEIIKQAATLLGRDDLVSFVETPSGQVPNTMYIGEINKTVNLTNMVIKEFALSYVPMKCSETQTAENGKVYYSSLTHKPSKIIKVTNAEDTLTDFALMTEYIDVKDDVVTVEYEFMPPDYAYNDTVDYDSGEVPVYILALGVAAEFCLTINWFSEAVMWHDRYLNEAQKLYKPKNAKTKQRSWV